MHKNKYLFVAFLFTILLTIISLRESEDIPDISIPYLDKAFHLLAYVVLTFLWSKYASLKFTKANTDKVLTVVVVLLTIYGIIIEVLQSKMTATRTFEISDILANLIGIAFGLLIYKYSIKHKLNSNKGLFF